MPHESIIEVKELVKTYTPQDSEPVEAIKGVSFDICATDFVIVYGPSGCGKSTLLHCLIGLEPSTSGQIVVRGCDITKLSEEERSFMRADKFGMVYQQPYWVKSLNVWENVALPLLIAGENEKKARLKAIKALEEVEMAKYFLKNPVRLSGGQQQRVGMARALVNDPWIIIADEPTGNLDTASAQRVIEVLKSLNHDKHRTIIMVTHNLSYLPLANKKIAMLDGRIEGVNMVKLEDEIKKELKEFENV